MKRESHVDVALAATALCAVAAIPWLGAWALGATIGVLTAVIIRYVVGAS